MDYMTLLKIMYSKKFVKINSWQAEGDDGENGKRKSDVCEHEEGKDEQKQKTKEKEQRREKEKAVTLRRIWRPSADSEERRHLCHQCHSSHLSKDREGAWPRGSETATIRTSRRAVT